MSTIRLPKVPMIPQHKDGTCWYASMCMLAEWRKATKGGLGGMVDPTTHSGCQETVRANRTWDADNTDLLVNWLHVKSLGKSDVEMNFDSLSSTLKESGPIWAAGTKTWGTPAHGHVIVIFGVADTGVLIHDPEPMHNGTEVWKTWSSINQFINGGGFDDPYLVCP